jgi:predicted nucleic acid-binding protein
VATLVFLDRDLLGLASKQTGKSDADACRSWLSALELAGAFVLIAEIVNYKVRRELVRVGATARLRRLDALLGRFTLLPLERPALLRAADLWAHVRNVGLPTADPHPLDADAILAGQALTAAGPGTPSSSRRRTSATSAASLESTHGLGIRSRDAPDGVSAHLTHLREEPVDPICSDRIPKPCGSASDSVRRTQRECALRIIR